MSDLDKLDAEIRRLQQEAAAVERAGPTFDERWPAVEAELLEAEVTFRRLGPQLSGFISQAPEHVHQRRQAMVGMAMVANRKALLDSERSRVKAACDGGLSAADKAKRLDELRRQLLRAAAQHELALREVEAVGEFRPRAVCPELVVYRQADLERIAR